jgi:hypothetical protein
MSKKDCLTCHYEPDWYHGCGRCKRFGTREYGLSDENTYIFAKYTDPDEIRCNGETVRDCVCWKPKTEKDLKLKNYTTYVRILHTMKIKVQARNKDDAMKTIKTNIGKYNTVQYIRFK